MRIWSIAWLCALCCSFAAAEVVTCPAPEGEPPCSSYQLTADGQNVAVYTARVLDAPFADKQWDFGGPYSFANLDASGVVKVQITSARSLRDAVIRPAWPDVKRVLVDDHTLLLTVPGPRKMSIEPEGKNGPLLLFVNPLEEAAPQSDAVDVIYFGPGIHKPGKIEIASGQTLYLAGGAVVKGGVLAHGDDIVIRGRGILDGSDWPWRQGPTPTVISIRGNHVTVSGITIRGASHWTIVPRDSRYVTVRNVKLCNSRVQNDDGINPCNSQDVLITDCFIRSDDDSVAIKGLDFSGDNPNVERITVENSILWCDRARIFLLGHESRAHFMRDIQLRNLDIIHFSMTPFLFEPGEEMRLENVTVENVRIHGEGQNELIRLRPVVNQYMRNKVPGHIRGIEFRGVAVSGQDGPYRVQLIGADADHRVQDVTFGDVSICGEQLRRESPPVSIGEHVEEVQFTER
jgi:hypothetical protein